MKNILETAFTAVLVLCAVVVTGLLVRREFFPPPPPAQPEAKPIFVTNWRDYLDSGERMGPDDAPVQFIEFADFECPFCGSFHKDMKALRERYFAQVALTYLHFPLPSHRFAEPAARAAECARAQARFEPMHDQLFEQQDEFGLKSWTEMAREAGVRDLAVFDACAESKDPIPRVVEGKQLGEKLDVKGTPTLIVNGWMLARTPTARELDDMVKGVLAGKSPVP